MLASVARKAVRPLASRTGALQTKTYRRCAVFYFGDVLGIEWVEVGGVVMWLESSRSNISQEEQKTLMF